MTVEASITSDLQIWGILVSGCDGGYSVLNEAKWPNTKAQVVGSVRYSQDQNLQREATYGWGAQSSRSALSKYGSGDPQCPLQLLFVVTGTIELAAIYCHPLSTPRISRYLRFIIYILTVLLFRSKDYSPPASLICSPVTLLFKWH